MSPQIFISYSHKDTDFASKVTKNLENEGYDIWLDRMDIQTGSRWDDEIVKGLDASQIFMVLLSNTSVASQNVKDEISYAIDHNKSIVPLLLESCEIPFRLRRVQYVDFTSRSFNEGLQIVLNILRSFQSETKHQKPSLSKEKPMDLTTLAASVTALVAPYLAKLGETAMEKVGEQWPENIWNLIVQRFKGNPVASGVSKDLVQEPDDPDNQKAFTDELKKVLRDDVAFTRALSEMMEKAQSNISNVGSGAIATGGSIGVGNVEVGGDLSGNIVIGNNNQVSGSSKKRRKRSSG
jgi:TIR domain-containing protein